RLESLNKQYGTSILIGELTRVRIGDEFVVRKIDQVVVAGKDEATRIYELHSAAGKAEASVLKLFELYEAGLAAYRTTDWDKAEELFKKCLEIKPEDGPTKTLLARIESLRSSPMASDWDGIWRFETK
ncbi:MAG: tetratricopeptide repeat protein, partial [Pseudomonadales bacterium]|nr:tetratricopeptide repeat protein [Pseudomonadales bacterium]